MFIFIGLVVGAFWLGFLQGSPILGGVLGALSGWVYQLMSRIKKLETAQQALTQQFQALQQHDESGEVMADDASGDLTPSTSTLTQQEEHQHSPPLSAAPLPLTTTRGSEQDTEPATAPLPQGEVVAATGAVAQVAEDLPRQGENEASLQSLADEAKSDILSRGFAAAKDWLFGGNPFVRAGIVLLFIGFVFLMRYSLEKNLIPVELRLLAAAIGALALLGFGWKFRGRTGAYGLILQAGGVGLLYLTVFAAFSLYQLLPSLLAFALLVLIVAAAVGLAVLQNSLPLAMFATAGGFMAPLLVSSGSNNYIGLFSFYALLNLGIVCIAWFKSWRLLNLLGFVFTFAIAALWGWSSYQPDNFATVEPFLILFFLFYVAIAILFALRTPVNFKDKVDSTLLFGTPILGFALQIALVQDFDYGIAISALVLGGFYLLLAAVMWQRFGKTQRLLCETFVVLGVIFATLAIPFAVDGAMTAAAWAIEGAGVLWISIRQQQWLRRGFAVLLQYGALVSLVYAMLFEWPTADAIPFINGQFIAGALVAGALLFSSWLLAADFSTKRRYENGVSLALLISGLLFLTACLEVQIQRFSLLNHNLLDYFVALHLGYAVVVSIALLGAARIKHWPALSFALPVPLLLMGLAGLAMLDLGDSLFAKMGWLLWPAAFITYYSVLYLYQRKPQFSAWLTVLQVVVAWLLIVLLSYEVHWQMRQYFAHNLVDLNGWYVAALPLVSIAAIWLTLKTKFWPLSDHRVLLQHYVALPLAGLLLFWALFSIRASGASAPLFWLPLLNPLDVVIVLWGITMLQLYRQLRGEQPVTDADGAALDSMSLQSMLTEQAALLRLAAVGVGFIWLNMMILRAMHHWYGLPWSIPGLLGTPETQTVLAIVWTLSGLLLSWLGSRRGNRYLWFAGTVLLGLVVLKLFVVDFASSGTLARIISFLSVGVLLLFVGFLAPLPPTQDEGEPEDADSCNGDSFHDDSDSELPPDNTSEQAGQATATKVKG